MKQNKSEKGITLIALIITIIIMIILAAVSIKEIVGENSIITAAEKAATDYVEAEKEEQNILQNIFDQAEYFTSDKASDVITASNYGDSVNYEAGGVTDWKIFYNDGAHVFLIAGDVVSINDETATALGVTRDGDYAIYWADEADLKHVGAEDIDPKVADRYMLSWYESYPTSTNISAKATAALLDTDMWNIYANNEYAIDAIGSPTYEMYISSFLRVNKDIDIRLSTDSNGYFFIDGDGAPEFRNFNSENVYKSNPYKSEICTRYSETKCQAYWLAGPSYASQKHLGEIENDLNIGNYLAVAKCKGTRG